MGRQIQIYVTNDDLAVLQDAISATGPVIFLKSEWTSPEPEPVSTLRIVKRCDEPWALYMCRKNDVSAIRTIHVPSQCYWRPDVLTSPVIELDRSLFDDVVCTRGRLYYVTGYFDDDGNWLEKPQDFLDWAGSVTRVTRRAFRRDPGLGAYLGPQAVKLKAEGRVQFPLNW